MIEECCACLQVYQVISTATATLDNVVEFYTRYQLPSLPGLPATEPIVTTLRLRHSLEILPASSVQITFEDTQVNVTGASLQHVLHLFFSVDCQQAVAGMDLFSLPPCSHMERAVVLLCGVVGHVRHVQKGDKRHRSGKLRLLLSWDPWSGAPKRQSEQRAAGCTRHTWSKDSQSLLRGINTSQKQPHCWGLKTA